MRSIEIKFAYGSLVKSNDGLMYFENEADYESAYFPGGIMLKVGDNELTGRKNSKQGYGYFGDYPFVEFIAWLKILSIRDGNSLKCYATEEPDFILFELIEKDTVLVINYSGGQHKKILNSDIIRLSILVPEIINAGERLLLYVKDKDMHMSDDPIFEELSILLYKLKKEWEEYQNQVV